jgi:glycine cleavage system H protein
MAEYRGCVLPEDLFYDLDYVWFRRDDNGLVTIGVTDPAQTMAGRVQAATIKKPGTEIRAGRHVATLESGKWVGGVPVPFAATVVERNGAVLAQPHLLNVDPYGEGWIARLEPKEPEAAFAGLSTGAAAIAALRQWIDRYDVECMRCSE